MEDLKVFNFGKVSIPQPYEPITHTDEKFVPWCGTDGFYNTFPNYLLRLYRESPLHSAIINQKANFLIGDGLKTEDGEKVNFFVNAADSVSEFVDKIIKDFLIYNAFAVEVVVDLSGTPVQYHFVPLHKIRSNKSKTKFWITDDWTGNKKPIIRNRWSPLVNEDLTTKIFWFDAYNVSGLNTYPTPDYTGAMKSIETDISIRDFNLNNIKNHFSVSSIITFFSGSTVSEDVKRVANRELESTYTGENGKKLIVDYQAASGKPADVKQLGANDWSESYLAIGASTKDDIVMGHGFPQALVMKTAGQLGGNQEMETAYETFKRTYVASKRAVIESALNMLFKDFDQVNSQVKFADKQLFSSITSATKEKIYTINELRAEAGLPALPGGDRLLSEPAVPKQAPEAQQTDPAEAPVEQEADVVKKKSRKLTEDDFEQIKHLGASFEDFEELEEVHEHSSKLKFYADEDVAKYVVDNDIKNMTVDQLNKLIAKEGINMTTKELQNILDKLNQSGVVKVDYKDGKVNILPSKIADVPDTGEVMVVYKYKKRPEVPGADLLDTSRSFCVKLINNARYYTREEVQTMSSIFGYNVFQYAGGFFYNSETDETTPYCRHMWQAVKVKRKNQN